MRPDLTTPSNSLALSAKAIEISELEDEIERLRATAVEDSEMITFLNTQLADFYRYFAFHELADVTSTLEKAYQASMASIGGR